LLLTFTEESDGDTQHSSVAVRAVKWVSLLSLLFLICHYSALEMPDCKTNYASTNVISWQLFSNVFHKWTHTDKQKAHSDLLHSRHQADEIWW